MARRSAIACSTSSTATSTRTASSSVRCGTFASLTTSRGADARRHLRHLGGRDVRSDRLPWRDAECRRWRAAPSHRRRAPSGRRRWRSAPAPRPAPAGCPLRRRREPTPPSGPATNRSSASAAWNTDSMPRPNNTPRSRHEVTHAPIDVASTGLTTTGVSTSAAASASGSSILLLQSASPSPAHHPSTSRSTTLAYLANTSCIRSAMREHEAGEVERVHRVTRNALANPGGDVVEWWNRGAGRIGEVGRQGGDATRRRDHADAADRAMPVRRELGEQLRTVEQVVDVGRVEHAVLAEREVVDPTFVGDRARVRLHDRACPRRPAELERDDGLPGVAGGGDAGEEVRRAPEGLDDDADDGGERIGRRDGDEVGQVADGLVTGRDHDRHAERSFPGGRSRGPGEEPALGDDAHAANRRGAGNRQVEPPAGEEAHAEGDVAEPGAVRTDDGEDVRSAMATSRSWASTPSGPVSAKPDATTTTPPHPSAAASSTTVREASALTIDSTASIGRPAEARSATTGRP